MARVGAGGVRKTKQRGAERVMPSEKADGRTVAGRAGGVDAGATLGRPWRGGTVGVTAKTNAQGRSPRRGQPTAFPFGGAADGQTAVALVESLILAQDQRWRRA